MISKNYKTRDTKFLLAEEYEMTEVINDECFRVKNFEHYETNDRKALNSLMKCFIYQTVKLAISENSEIKLNKINEEIKLLDLSLRDLPVWRADNSFIHGEIYIPPLELAMEKRSFSAFRYILEKTVDTKIRLLSAAPSVRAKSGLSRSRSSVSLNNSIELNLTCLREKAELLEMDEIIDILDDFEEDKEIKALERESSGFNFNIDEAPVKVVVKKLNPKAFPNTNTNQLYLKSIMKKPLYDNNDKALFKLQALIANTEVKKKRSNSIHKIDSEHFMKLKSNNSYQKESKLCSIL